MHDCVDDFLLLPHTQKALSQECKDRWINELLDGSLKLLDVCGTLKESLSQMKESTHELESIMRWRWGCEISFLNDVQKYLAFRKHVERAICKASKAIGSKCTNKSHEIPAIVRGESSHHECFWIRLLLHSDTKLQSKRYLVSKLMQPRRIACESDEADINYLKGLILYWSLSVITRWANLITTSNWECAKLSGKIRVKSSRSWRRIWVHIPTPNKNQSFLNMFKL